MKPALLFLASFSLGAAGAWCIVRRRKDDLPYPFARYRPPDADYDPVPPKSSRRYTLHRVWHVPEGMTA